MDTLMQAYDEYADNKMASKEASKEINRKLKDFFESIGQKENSEFKKSFKGYLRNNYICNRESDKPDKVFVSDNARNYYLDKISGIVTSEQIKEYYDFYETKKDEKNRYTYFMKNIIDSYADNDDNIDKVCLRTFFNYRFQKQVKGESPIDSIEEYELMLENGK